MPPRKAAATRTPTWYYKNLCEPNFWRFGAVDERIFHFGKVRYRGLAKNKQRLALLLGLGNLMTTEGQPAG